MKNGTLRQDVMQMVMPRINGPELADPAYRERIDALVREGIGGFILFGGDVEETPRLLEALQTQAAVPLLISSDVERGLGQQLSGGTRFPGQRAVASAIRRRSKKDVELLDRMLDAVRNETRAAGIHIVFSPVVDVNNNPRNPIICTRAFGDEPGIVEWFGSRYIRGLQKHADHGRMKLLACAKHFPGHGDTDQDSHSVLPVIRAEKHRLNSVELPPFREAVKDGVATIMVAHLLVPALDADAPTTFSKKIVTMLLREGMGFEGLIVSDALDMGALAGQYSQEEIAVRAVEAGMDILLHPQDARTTVDAVVAAVESGRLTRQRIAESLEKIMHAKTKLGLFDRESHALPHSAYERNQRTAREIGGKAPRIVGSKSAETLPVPRGARVACFIIDDDNNRDTSSAFIRAMQSRFEQLSVMVLTPEAEPASSAFASLGTATFVVLAVYSRIAASKGRSGISEGLRSTMADLIHRAAEANAKSVVISFDSPYILDQYEEADVRIAAYDRMDEIQQAAATMLAGA
jgi:beta-N-acetylhexosaminidase